MSIRDSARWCDECQAHGDHHTDRHEMYKLDDAATRHEESAAFRRFRECPKNEQARIRFAYAATVVAHRNGTEVPEDVVALARMYGAPMPGEGQ